MAGTHSAKNSATGWKTPRIEIDSGPFSIRAPTQTTDVACVVQQAGVRASPVQVRKVAIIRLLTAEVEDKRKDYGETRIICFGVLQSRLVVIGYTPRGTVRHVFSMRKANEREQARFAPYFGL